MTEVLFDRLDAPTPFMMGLKTNLWHIAKENVRDGTYVIDLNKDKIF